MRADEAIPMVRLVAGLLAPIGLWLGGTWLEGRGVLPIDGPVGAVVGLVLIGCVTGLLLQRWWATLYVPIGLGIPSIVIAGLTGFTMEPGERSTVGSMLLAAFWVALLSIPYVVGVLIGIAGNALMTAARHQARH